jgi:hypothetical protein
METIMSILQAIQLNAMEVIAAVFTFFGVGYWYGRRKSEKLQTRVYKLENDILELHAELLYGKDEARVIEIRNPAELTKNIANR